MARPPRRTPLTKVIFWLMLDPLNLMSLSQDPLVTISAEGKITDVNEATIRVTGVDREHLVGTDFSDYFTEPDRAREGHRQVFAQGFVTDYPLTIRHTWTAR